jgi:membrane protease YdiL (CAAX protease family)
MFLRIGIFYFLTWFFLMLLGGLQQETGILPPEIGLAQWGPGIAALLMLVLFRRDGHTVTFFSKETPILRYVYAALIPVGVGLVVFLVKSLLSIEPSTDTSAENSLLTMVLWMPLGALGEELGWRGYLHKKLDTQMRGLWSSLLVGVLWMPIHLHFFGEGAIFLLFLALLIVSYSVVIYALVQDTGFNVLLASIFHLFINIANLLFLDVIYETPFMVVNALVWVVVALMVVFMKKELFLASKG